MIQSAVDEIIGVLLPVRILQNIPSDSAFGFIPDRTQRLCGATLESEDTVLQPDCEMSAIIVAKNK